MLGVVLLAWVGCKADTVGPSRPDPGPLPGDTGEVVSGDSVDTTAGEPDPGGTGFDPGLDEGRPPERDWEIGDGCRGNEDCPGGWCVEIVEANARVCTLSCFEACPTGWICTGVKLEGADKTFVCLPVPGTVCGACTDDGECGALARCVRPREGGEEGLCLMGCGSSGGGCAGGFACAPREALVDGAAVDVCAPVGTEQCCAHATRGLLEECSRSNEHGRCEGWRECLGLSGWGECGAKEPGPEICNETDDDCDGSVDEGMPEGCACGNGSCAEGVETPLTCPCDCYVCGDGVCTPCGEDPERCPEDCCGSCGDRLCAGPACTEDHLSCPGDCPDRCGDGLCGRGENPTVCEADCRRGGCGNGVCEPADGGPEECPLDCAAYCGNCRCDPETHDEGGGLVVPAEHYTTCPLDCGFCGDGFCSPCPLLREDPVRCPEDCCVARVESCNGLDDDCDGDTDEDFLVGEACAPAPGGACFRGLMECDPRVPVSEESLGASRCADAGPRDEGSPCGDYRCVWGYQQLPPACAGAGVCVFQGWRDCGGEECADSVRCAGGCTVDAGCRRGYRCDGGRCVALEAECEVDADCVDGDVCSVDLCDRGSVCGRYPREPCGPEDDADRDGVKNAEDLCPEHPDPDQRDEDLDGVGDACDPCVSTAEREIFCDGADEDCDGLTDEDYDVGAPCDGGDDPCRDYALRCVGPQTAACRGAAREVGAVCSDSVCVEAVLTEANRCDEHGLCRPTGTRSCAPYGCADEKSCRSDCGTSADCLEGRYCFRGSCLPRGALSEPCLSDEGCESGRCADGVCCEQACDAECMRCGAGGLCAPVLLGADPDTCAGDRSCDAEGRCRVRLGARCRSPAECLSGYCADGTCCAEVCEGVCRSCALRGSEGRCGVVRLDEDKDSCADRHGCDSWGRCRLKHGQACSRDDECIRGYCSDGLCCTERCSEPCQRCDRPGSRGTCVARTGGEDPDTCRGVATCDGAGRCKLRLAAVCTADSDCLDGHCSGGVCCDSPCAAPCRSCTEPGAVGACAALLNVEQPGVCSDGAVCDGTGRCVQRRGQPCFGPEACASALCVDGFCCDSACEGTCEACDVGGREGLCSRLPDGTDPEPECGACRVCDGQGACRPVVEGADSKDDCDVEPGCGRDGSCDGAAGCRLRGAESACGTAECVGAVLSPAEVCDGRGACVQPPELGCPGGYACEAGDAACRSECSLDGHCAPGHFCRGAACLPKRDLGAGCSGASGCASGACVDGVCCERECPGACRSCALSGLEGRCELVPAGQDPRGACGGDRACDGEGRCAAPAGESCAEAEDCLSGHCADGVCCVVACEGPCERCGAGGVCKPAERGTDPDLDCDPGRACDGSSGCLALLGQLCSSADDCLDGHCADGVCCRSACDAACEACGAGGWCLPAPAGEDPGSDCDSPALCDGRGGCALPEGVPCSRDSECVSGACVDGLCCDETCDQPCHSCADSGEDGHCAPVPPGGDPRSECPGSRVCDGAGGCALPAGESCAAPGECLSGHCAAGVCCDSPCVEACVACDLPGALGRCSAAPAGADPRDACPGQQVCAAGGGCVKPDGVPCADGDDCLSGHCVDERCCEGACDAPCERCDHGGGGGRCLPAAPGSDPDGDCRASAVCGAAGVCVGEAGEPCVGSAECLSGTCSDAVCCESACEGSCVACDLDGAVGVCAVVAAGEDPRSACGEGRACDGSGSCAGLGRTACESGGDCLSGACADGLCCDSACDGPCEMCNLAAAAGTCTPVPRGIDPDGDCAGVGVCDGSGGCVRPNGRTCSAGSDCLSGHCSDGVCCGTACDGVCEGCNEPGRTGACSPLGVGVDPAEDCPGAGLCDGARGCALPLGAPCADGAECLSDVCLDGVCCPAGCTGRCRSCAVAGSEGTCGDVLRGTDLDGDCPGEELCDGAGGCVKPEGLSCTEGQECLSELCVDGRCCAGACDGLCETCALPGSEGSCAPVEIGEDPDNECAGPDACDGARGCRAYVGETCAGDGECLSGRCADTVCCDEACAEPCRSCALSGGVGECGFVPRGQDPDGDCAGAEVCDGAGGCLLPVGEPCGEGVECLSGHCSDDVCCAVACAGACEACDLAGREGECAPAAEGSDPGNDCPPGNLCDGTRGCAKERGIACVEASECLSGHCADGLCCESACAGVCEACDLAAGRGSCLPVARGEDPAEECAGDSACSGAGACVRPLGEPCGSATDCLSDLCRDGVCCDEGCDALCAACDLAGSEGRCADVPPGADPDEECETSQVCDGSGACVRPAGEACGDGVECLSGNCVDGLCCDKGCGALCEACDLVAGTCAHVPRGEDPAGECAGDAVCGGSGDCVSPDGDGCGADEECLGGRCVDGFCCESPCAGLCEACDVGGAEGTCVPVPAESDPAGECAGTALCDGAGACRRPVGEICSDGADCLGAACVDGRCCEAACDGLCEACDLGGQEGVCAPVQRGADPDGECPGGAVCDGAGDCARPDAAGCSDGAECLSGFCTDGVCCATECAETCFACDLVGSEGECVVLPHGEGEGSECPAGSACDGTGRCLLVLGDEGCTAGDECLSGHCSDGRCCDLACDGPCESCRDGGLCQATVRGEDPEEDCPGDDLCDGSGGCVQPVGGDCVEHSDCALWSCVDERCCDGPCLGACMACDVAGSAGACTPVPAESDPHGDCGEHAECDGAGACVHLPGRTCVSADDCFGASCVDGYCCDSECGGLCEACDGSGSLGLCTRLAAGEDPDNECVGTEVCNGGGACVRVLGEGCSVGEGCLSGYCADEVCCEGACAGTCLACDRPGAEGSCSSLAAGSDPDDDCPGDAVCGQSPRCVDLDGVACDAAADCLSGNCVDGVCCAEADCLGACKSCAVPGLEGSCANVPAGSDLRDACTGEEVCDGSGRCVGLNASPCAQPADCLSGRCADGVCCDTACNSACERCDGADIGTCAPVVGEDDEDTCAGALTCDGAGACLKKDGQPCAGGSGCASGICVDEVCCEEICDAACRRCHGASRGTCEAVTGTEDPGTCEGTQTCDATGACKAKAGEPCSGPGSCGMLVPCVDGVCCDDACEGVCEACDLAGSEGTCAPVPAATDPDLECASGQRCDGVDRCRAVDGTPCGDGEECLSRSCLDGVCCAMAMCHDTCSSCAVAGKAGRCTPIPAGSDPDDECPGAQVCDGADACVRPDGDSCELGAECLSGYCADGVCCDGPCSEECESCAIFGFEGICTLFEVGTDPTGECTSGSVCDGAGACKKTLFMPCLGGVECLSGHCADEVCCDTACEGSCHGCKRAGFEGTCVPHAQGTDPEDECPGEALCSGTGGCIMPDGVACERNAECISGYCRDGKCCAEACDGVCRRCGNLGVCGHVPQGTDPDGDCAEGSLCDGAGACKADLGQPCGDGAECWSGRCTDGVCCDEACDTPCSSCDVSGYEGTCSNDDADACEDGDACTLGDLCVGGACEAGAAADCDDGDLCTNDGCDPASGCAYTANAGAACDDADACTEDDACVACNTGDITFTDLGQLPVPGAWERTDHYDAGSDTLFALPFYFRNNGNFINTVYAVRHDDQGILSTVAQTQSRITEGSFDAYWVTLSSDAGYLYAAGSIHTAMLDYAPIGADGTLGAWTKSGLLPTGTRGNRSNHVMPIHNGRIYVLGGWWRDSQPGFSDSWYATLNGDGSFGAFTETTALPAAMRWAGAVISPDGVLYLTNYYRDLYAAEVQADGTLGSFSSAFPLGDGSSGRTSNGVALAGADMLAVVGPNAVYFVRLGGGGALAAMAAEVATPQTFASRHAYLRQGKLYVAGQFATGTDVFDARLYRVDGVDSACAVAACRGSAVQCAANASCTDVLGAPVCVCDDGYEGDGGTCSDADECALGSDDCGSNATCTNTPGSFVCTCNAGFAGDGRSCVDEDECAAGSDDCDTNATCTNRPGSFVCACNDGFMGDGRTCTPEPLFADGEPCVANDDCESERCVDGTCCATECPGLCKACNVPGSEGTCTSAPRVEGSAGPSARASPAMAYDSARGRIVLFGGNKQASGDDPGGLGADTWELDGSRWHEVSPADPEGDGNPPARRRHAMAFHAVKRRMVLFGGVTSTGTKNDTWTYDGSSWTRVQADPEGDGDPSARQNAAITYDEARGVVLLFGGNTGNGWAGDLWAFNGESWELLGSGGAPDWPPARVGGMMAWAADIQRPALFGGFTNDRHHQTTVWTWDGSAWTELTRGSPAPSGRSYGVLVGDPSRSRLVLSGGNDSSGRIAETWEHAPASNTWSQASPSDPEGDGSPLDINAHAGAYHATTARVVIFGGATGQATSPVYRDETWLFDGVSWDLLEASDPDDECTGQSVCNGEGACSVAEGSTCEKDSECTSGHCVDGYCCDEACDGLCEACDLAGSLGQCGPLGSAEDPSGECPDDADLCTVEACDGAGACASLPVEEGTLCDDGDLCTPVDECTAGACVGGHGVPEPSAVVAVNTDAATDSGHFDETPVLVTDRKGNWLTGWAGSGREGGDADLFAAASDDGGSTWTGPFTINSDAATDSYGDIQLDMATDGQDVWIAVWTKPGGTGGSDNDIYIARSNHVGSSWTDVALLDTNAATDSGYDYAPSITTDGGKNWIVAWHSTENLNGVIGGDTDILFTNSAGGGGVYWSTAGALKTTATSDANAYDTDPCVLTDGNGIWVLVWVSNDSLGDTIGLDSDILFQRSASSNGASQWSAPAALTASMATDSRVDYVPTLAVDGEGTWITAWSSQGQSGDPLGTDRDILFSRSVDGAQTWSEPLVLNSYASTDSGTDFYPRVAADELGGWIATWSTLGGVGELGSDIDVILSSSLDGGLTWSSPVPAAGFALSDNDTDEAPAVAIDRFGSWVLAWSSDNTVAGEASPDPDILSARGRLVRSCDDDVDCTTDACDSVAGECTHTPNHAECDDDLLCTADTCDPISGCTNTPNLCDDGNPCTDGECMEQYGGQCAYRNNTATCDDGNVCTTGDVCADGVCAGADTSAVDCDDGDACTVETCDAVTGCASAPDPLLGQPCDGADADLCENGTWTCKADKSALECVNEAVEDVAEVCNGVDDDCDTDTDEGLAAADRCRGVFVASDCVTFSGAAGGACMFGGNLSLLNGIAEADAHCRTLAAANGIPNAEGYVAWLSTSADDAYCRVQGLSGKRSGLCGQAALPAGGGPWARPDGAFVAADVAQLTGGDCDSQTAAGIPDSSRCLSNPISLDEQGLTKETETWTGTYADGTLAAGKSCGDWTGSAVGFISGYSPERGKAWSFAGEAMECSTTNKSIYCFEVGRVLGSACTEDADCEGRRCVDGVCCAEVCDGDCRTCATPGSEGTCTPVAGADDPGTCEGEQTCDPTGACKVAPGATCNLNEDCALGTCIDHVCMLSAGEACEAAVECGSGHCVDEVCCSEPCDELCETCGAAGTEGTCTPVRNNLDVDTCTGTCDALGRCGPFCSEVGGLQPGAPWATRGGCAGRNGRSPYSGARSAALRWSYDSQGSFHEGPTVARDGTIYLGTGGGVMHAVTPEGQEEWTFTAGGAIAAEASIGADGTLYFSSGDYHLYALHPDGTERWSVDLEAFASGAPAIDAAGNVYVAVSFAATSTNDIVSFTSDGAQRWRVPSTHELYPPVTLAPGPILVIPTERTRIFALDAAGDDLWINDLASGAIEGAAVGPDGKIYLSATFRVLGLDKAGNELWRYTRDRYQTYATRDSGPALGADGTVYIGGFDNYLFALKPDGTLRWSFQTTGSVISSPAVGAHGNIYFGCSDNNIYAARPDGTELWSYDAGSAVVSSPAIGADGTIYAGTQGGLLIALGPCADADCIRANGLACTVEDQCASGHCAGGVCCDTACNGACMACDVAGSEGTCTQLPPAPAFTGPTAVNTNAASDSRNDRLPRVASDHDGTWLVAWETQNDIGGSGLDQDIAVASSTDGGGTWSAPRIANSNASSSDAHFAPDLASDRSGEWMLVWTTFTGGESQIEMATSADAGQSWTTAGAFAGVGDSLNDFYPRVIHVGSPGSGRYLVAYQSPGAVGPDSEIKVVSTKDGGGSWSEPVLLSTEGAGDARDWDVAFAADGNDVVAVWTSEDTLGGTLGSDEDILVARSGDHGKTWSLPKALNSDAATDTVFGHDEHPAVATDGSGAWVAVWQGVLGGSSGDRDLHVSRSSDGGATWTPLSVLNLNAGTDAGQDVGPVLAAGAAGTFVALWWTDDDLGGTAGSDFDVLAAVSHNSGLSWSVPALVHSSALTDTGNDWEVALSADGTSRWIAVWQSYSDLGATIGTDADVLSSAWTTPEGVCQ